MYLLSTTAYSMLAAQTVWRGQYSLYILLTAEKLQRKCESWFLKYSSQGSCSSSVLCLERSEISSVANICACLRSHVTDPSLNLFDRTMKLKIAVKSPELASSIQQTFSSSLTDSELWIINQAFYTKTNYHAYSVYTFIYRIKQKPDCIHFRERRPYLAFTAAQAHNFCRTRLQRNVITRDERRCMKVDREECRIWLKSMWERTVWSQEMRGKLEEKEEEERRWVDSMSKRESRRKTGWSW